MLDQIVASLLGFVTGVAVTAVYYLRAVKITLSVIEQRIDRIESPVEAPVVDNTVINVQQHTNGA